MSDLPALRRDADDAQLAGVCAALAREWRVDPLLVRLGFVLAALVTNGFAIAFYLVGWALIPRAGATTEPIRELLPFTRGWSRAALTVAVVTAAVVGMATTGVGPGALGVLAIVWLVLRFGRRDPAARGRPVPPPVPRTEFERLGQAWQQRLDNVDAGRHPSWEPPVWAPNVGGAESPHEARAAMARRRGRRTWLAVLTALGAVWGSLGLLDAFGAALVPDGVPLLAWVAGTLAVLALALVIVARPGRAALGRPPGLVVAAVAGALVTGALMAPEQSPMLLPSGVSSYAFGDLDAEHELPMGEQVVDLRDLDLRSSETVSFEQDLGRIVVLLPADTNVRVRATADVGAVTLPDRADEGLDLELTWERVDASGPVLTVHVRQGLGDVEVRA